MLVENPTFAMGGLDLGNIICTPCDSCSICTRRWHEMFLPVYRSTKLPVSAILAGNMFWKETLFDRAAGGIYRMHVDSLFLSLIAAGMIKMTMQNNALQWVITREYDPSGTSIIESHLGRPIYKRDDVWDGIHLFCENRMRRRQRDL